MQIEYLEKLGNEYRCETWMVRADGVLGIAHVYEGGDPVWLQLIHADTAPWQGFTHEHLVPVHYAHHEGERLVIVSGDQRGPRVVDAAKLLTEPVDREQWATIEIAGIAEAIAAMANHKPGFVHGRANHEHTVVGGDGKARLLSAIAWISHPRGTGWVGRGNVMTGLHWLSPEQARGQQTSPASDVFQLAATLYAALTLRRPFQGSNDFETLKQIIDGPRPPRIDGTPALSELVLRNLAVDPAQRDRDPATFAAHLRRIHRVTSADLRARVAALRPTKRPAPHESAAIRGYRCTKQWAELSPTPNDGIRYCGECKHDVVQVRSVGAVIPLLGKRCIAYIPE